MHLVEGRFDDVVLLSRPLVAHDRRSLRTCRRADVSRSSHPHRSEQSLAGLLRPRSQFPRGYIFPSACREPTLLLLLRADDRWRLPDDMQFRRR